MNACIQAITSSKILQLIIIVDSLSIILQAYFISNYQYLILATTLTCIHIIVLIMEHCYQGKNSLTMFCLNILKGTAQLIVHYQLEESWLIFAGIQITCLLKQDLQHLNLIAFILFLVQIFSIAYVDQNFMVVGILRTVFNYFLITQIFRLEKLNYFSFLENILKNISHEEFCLLDDNFKPIFKQQVFSKFEDEQVVGLNEFYNQTRVITPRDYNSQLIRGSNDEESKSTLPIKEVIQHLKKSKMQILAKKKLTYEINNSISSNISIEKLSFSNLGYLIMISKRKLCDNQKQNDHVQTMINTVHKVSHDMRNPLNAIINMQMCLKDQIDQIDSNLSQKYLKPSLNSCHLLLNLINDILDAAQVGNNRIKLIIRKFNLSKLIEKTISIFDILKEKKELKISFNYDQKLPKKIFSDKLRIRQIIMNLLSNAIKYTQPKGSVLIECQHSNEKQNVIVVSIQDTGFGIKPENLKYLFKQFSKVEDSENQKANPMGIGLGLMISNELAILLSKNQCIQVHSEYGRGSKFFFEIENRGQPQEDLSESQISDTHKNGLPILDTRFMQVLSSQKSPTISLQIPQVESSNKIQLKPKHQANHNFMTTSLTFQPNLKTKSDERSIFRKYSFQANQISNLIQKWNENTHLQPPILVVDDDEVNIMVLYYLLEQLGFQSDSAMNGMDCLQKFQERQKSGTSYQLIFLDIHMPVMDGFETAKRLKQIDPIIMIVACSGDTTNQNELEQYKQSGIMSAVQKPVGKAQLKNVFLKLCDGMRQDNSL